MDLLPMVGFLESRLDYLFFFHGLMLAMIASAAWGLSHLENRRTWWWLALFGSAQATSIWLKAVALNMGDSQILFAARTLLLGGSYFCLIKFAQRKFLGMGLLRLSNWVHVGPAALLVTGVIWFGEPFLKWYLPVLGVVAGVFAGSSFLARSRGTRHQDFARRLKHCALAIGSYAAASGFFGIRSETADAGIDPLPTVITVLACTLLAGWACWTIELHYSLLHHSRLASQDIHWARKRAVQLAVILTISISGWLYADRAMHQKENGMRDDILLRTRLLAASLTPSDIASLKWGQEDLQNPYYHTVKNRLIALAKANPDIRFLMLTGLRDGKAYFLADSEPPDSPDYSPPGELYEDADDAYLSGALKHHEFVAGPLTDRWGNWVSASVPIGPIGPAGEWILAEADISAAHWVSSVRAARAPPLLITLLITLLFLTYFYAQDRIDESVSRLTVSEKRTSTLVEGSPNCVQMFDPEGRCTMINQNGLNALDRPRDAIIGKSYIDIWPQSAHRQIRESFEQALAGRASVFESEYHRPDGTSIIWRITLTPVQDEQHNIRSLVSIGVDISDLKQTEKDLLLAKEAAEAATRAKSEFLAVMSHEIRTPLGGVIGMLNVLRKHSMEPEQQLYTDLAHENAENLLGMLDDILDAAKVEAGKLTLECIPFDPVLEFGRVLEPMRVRAEAKKLSFSWTLAPDMPPALHGDPTRLRQVLANLLSNALKFTEQGSIVTTITASAAKKDHINLCIEVRDTGIGIEKQRLGRLFCRFEQADSSTTRRFGGTGLGLSIVKDLSELMQGSIDVTSTPGQGTSFKFTAVVGIGSREEISTSTAPQSALPRHRARLHILCAEDDLTNQVAAEFLVKQMGHTIEFVDDGRKAVEWLSSQRVPVVLMDNRMPVMDGFQATRTIRDSSSSVLDHDVYIIANTANAASGYRERCIAAGMNDYLTKPLREAELHAALEKAIHVLEQKGVQLALHEDLQRPTLVRASLPTTTTPPMPPPEGLSEAQLLAILDEAEAKPPATPQLPPEAMERITDLFYSETPVRLAEMQRALAAGDSESLARAAHSLKSSSRYVQADDLSLLCAEIEKMADAGKLTEITNLIAKADTCFSTYLDRHKPQGFPALP